MKYLVTLVIILLVAVTGSVVAAYSGILDVSANSPHSGVVHWLLSTASDASVERRAAYVDVPNLDDPELLRAGVNDYASMCAACHGAPGKRPEAVGKGLNPPPPDLAVSAGEKTPAELFWVTKNGIKMTGMPAWGVTHGDDTIWPVVAFMIALPELDANGYQALLKSAEGAGHHAVDVQTQPAEVSTDKPHHDGHDHTH